MAEAFCEFSQKAGSSVFFSSSIIFFFFSETSKIVAQKSELAF
jgi:hypothetical protein